MKNNIEDYANHICKVMSDAYSVSTVCTNVFQSGTYNFVMNLRFNNQHALHLRIDVIGNGEFIIASVLDSQYLKHEGSYPRTVLPKSYDDLDNNDKLYNLLCKSYENIITNFKEDELEKKNSINYDTLIEYLDKYDEPIEMYFKDVSPVRRLDMGRVLLLHWYGDDDFEDRSYHFSEVISIITKLRDARTQAKNIDYGPDILDR